MRKLKVLGVVALLALAIVAIVYRGNEIKRNYEYSETTMYYVERGDTLWYIAKQYSDNRHDVREVVYEIEKLSNCSANIQPGQALTIPVYNVMVEGE